MNGEWCVFLCAGRCNGGNGCRLDRALYTQVHCLWRAGREWGIVIARLGNADQGFLIITRKYELAKWASETVAAGEERVTGMDTRPEPVTDL